MESEDAVVNNLNMATSVGGVTCTNDLLGNRLTNAGADPVTYNWDALNRMSSLVRGGVTTSYKYRADGMRTLKSSSLGSTLYRYDGQMGVQDVVLNANGTLNRTVDYALGGRGIDGISTTTGSTTVVTYPLYDTHGNMVSTLTKGSGGSYTYSALRSFDAWGKVRLGATTGDPTGRYCATLGHKQDDESDLVYMRARYYEPSSGRFVSEDPATEGLNWYKYASNDPVNNLDRSGKESLGEVSLSSALSSGLVSSFISGFIRYLTGGSSSDILLAAAFGFVTGAGGSVGSQLGSWAAYAVPMIVNAFAGATKAILTGKGPGNAMGKAILGLAMGSLSGYFANEDLDYLDPTTLSALGTTGNLLGGTLIDAATSG